MNAPLVILLDLDGTLVDCSRAIVAATLATAAELDLPPPTREWALGRIGQPPLQTWELLGYDDPVGASEVFGRIVRPIMNDDLILLPGVAGALHRLVDGGARLGVATTRKTESARESLRVAGLLPWISQVSGRDLVKRPKPAPDVLRHALAALDVAPEHALMVGDHSADVLAAHAAGMPCFGVLGGMGSEKELREAGADLILATGLGALPEALRNSSARS